MLDGWYCRSLANEKASKRSSEDDTAVERVADESDSQETQVNDAIEEEGPTSESGKGAGCGDANKKSVDYKAQYRYLKRKLKFLIYENEFFQDALRSNQRRLLKVSRDRAFLLDRLLQYEQPEISSTESDETEESSDDDPTKDRKRKRPEQATSSTSIIASRKGRKRKASIVTTPTLPLPQTQPTPQLLPPKTTMEKMIKSNDLVGVTGDMSNQPVGDLEPQKLQLNGIALICDNNQQSVVNTHTSNNHQNQNVSMIGPTSVIVNPAVETNRIHSIHDDINEIPTHVAAEECVPMEYTN